MPSRARQVGFAPVPATYSRLPHDDELFVMKAFARHCSHCATCAHPYEVHRQGGTLCSKGHQRAQDVAQYAFNKAGQSFSVVDLESDRRIQIEIPVDCSAVRELLKAMERGLRLHRKAAPVVNYDKTYPVPPQVSHYDRDQQRSREPRYIRKPALETAEPPPYLAGRQKSNPHNRGMYEQEMMERERRYNPRQMYFSVGSRGPLPVPAKDDYY